MSEGTDLGHRMPSSMVDPQKGLRRQSESEGTRACGVWDGRLAGGPTGPGEEVYAISGVVAG